MCLLLYSDNYTLFSHSRCKLRVINWREDDLKIWAGSHEGEGLPDFRTEKQPIENSAGCEVKKELKVTTEVLRMKGRLDESTTYLLQWAQQRKDSIHLFCRKLLIEGLTKASLIEIFKTVHADCIQELVLNCIFIEELAFLNPYLRQMKSLFILTLDHIIGTSSMGDSEKRDEEKNIQIDFSTSHTPLSPETLCKQCLFYKRQPKRMPQVPEEAFGDTLHH